MQTLSRMKIPRVSPLRCRRYLALYETHSTEPPPQPEVIESFFRYTSGRWLYDEDRRMKKRYLKFDVQGLQDAVSEALQSRCVGITKLPEGQYNKVFTVQMENDTEILVRMPNPNAGHPRAIVASEVATLDFVCATHACMWRPSLICVVASQLVKTPSSRNQRLELVHFCKEPSGIRLHPDEKGAGSTADQCVADHVRGSTLQACQGYCECRGKASSC